MTRMSEADFAALTGQAPAKKGGKPRRRASSAPSEEAEQMAVIAWADAHAARWPELAFLLHIPNGGARNAVTGARLKAQGVRRGVPDLGLFVPRGGYHGLFIELKRAGPSSRLSPEQKNWVQWLRGQGYCAEVCYGADEAIAALEAYLERK